MSLPSEWMKFAPPPRPLSGDDKWNVFLSYRSVSRKWVLNLYDVLNELGHKVFMDQFVLKASDSLIDVLQAALTASQAGVLVWSNATRDSEWVRREYQVMETQATEKLGFHFVPVRLDVSKLPAFASQRVFLDFSSYPDGPNGGELLRLLHAVAGQPLSPDAVRFANQQDEAAKTAAVKIETAVKLGNPDRLIRLFEESGLPWRTTAALACKAAEGLTKLDHNDAAIAMLEETECQFPSAIRPQQLRALALARRGRGDDLSDAQEIVGELYVRGERDPETLGLFARTWMDRYEIDRNVGDLRQSRDYYLEAFAKAPDDVYTGINAAAKSILLGTPADIEKAENLTAQVAKLVGTEKWPNDYFMTATVAEVLLIQKKFADAARLYQEAVATARTMIGAHKSTWTQARRLMERLGPSEEERAMVAAAFDHLSTPEDTHA